MSAKNSAHRWRSSPRTQSQDVPRTIRSSVGIGGSEFLVGLGNCGRDRDQPAADEHQHAGRDRAVVSTVDPRPCRLEPISTAVVRTSSTAGSTGLNGSSSHARDPEVAEFDGPWRRKFQLPGCTSSGFGPASRPRSSSRSSTDRAIGPNTLTSARLRCSVGDRGTRTWMAPKLGLWPYAPQNDDGTRIEPPMSVPISNSGRSHRHCGRRAAGRTTWRTSEVPGVVGRPEDLVVALVVTRPPRCWSCRTRSPRRGAPCTTVASTSGTKSRSSVAPPVERIPAVAITQPLIVIATPSGPTALPLVRASSIAPASAYRTLPAGVITELIGPSRRSMRSRWASRSSRADTSPISRAARIDAVSEHASTMRDI